MANLGGSMVPWCQWDHSTASTTRLCALGRVRTPPDWSKNSVPTFAQTTTPRCALHLTRFIALGLINSTTRHVALTALCAVNATWRSSEMTENQLKPI